MIKLKNVKKNFNKGKITAINNTTLTFNNTGLTALLGPSGCGKTTLLNCIGGLDNINKGQIIINNEPLKKNMDKIRNNNIGYIFQDYKLLNNLTVFENVALSLKLIGIKDKKEIETRVNYCLETVGMLRYKKRLAFMLSGGEKQRVAIARALVKDANIILADEPTGNLDSKNSIEIMNLIKTIAKSKLIILVTHEQQLAKFYADRIIEIKDGVVINDYKNDHNDELDYQIETKFYLKDYQNNKTLENIKIYSNEEINPNLEIVIAKNNIYIKTNDNKNIEVINEQSNIEFINDNYKKIKQNQLIDTFEIQPIKHKKYSSVYKNTTFIKEGFQKVFSYSKIKKILLLGYVISSVLIVYALSTTAASNTHLEQNYAKTNQNYRLNEYHKLSLEQINQLDVKYTIPGTSILNVELVTDDFLQLSNETITWIDISVVDLNTIKDDQIIYGNKPDNEEEILIDTLLVEKYLKLDYSLQNANIIKAEDFINKYIKKDNIKYKITGITNTNNPSIYLNTADLINIISNDIKITDKQLNYNEILTNNQNEKINDIITINQQQFKVVGYHEEIHSYLVNEQTLKDYLFQIKKELTIYTDNELEGFTYPFEQEKIRYISQKELQASAIQATALMFTIASIVQIYLIMRSSFLSRIKEVAIKRAIGLKKIDIYKMFIGESIAITTITSIPGVILMSYIIDNLSKTTIFEQFLVINPLMFLTSIFIVTTANIIFGLLPVVATLSKTPSYILSRHDLE